MIKLTADTKDGKVNISIKLRGPADEIATEAALVCIKLPENLMDESEELFDLFDEYTQAALDQLYEQRDKEAAS